MAPQRRLMRSRIHDLIQRQLRRQPDRELGVAKKNKQLG
jgi:hypothetical protein